MVCLKSKITSSAGFSLIEVIATIIVMGILAAFFIHFVGTAVEYSWEAVEFVAGEAEAEGVIEQIIADYVRETNGDPDTNNALAALKGSSYGDNVTMAYIGFDENGNEIPVTSGTSELLKVTYEAPGKNLTVILPKSRWFSTDPIIEY